MPKSTQSKSAVKVSKDEQPFDMLTLYKSLETQTSCLKTHCLSNVPEELPEDTDVITKMFEKVRDGYLELCNCRELVKTMLNDFNSVMQRLARERAKANACVDVEQEPSAKENIIEDNDNTETEKDSDKESGDEQTEQVVKSSKKEPVEEAPKKKSKSKEPEPVPVPDPEPVLEPKKDKKDKKKKVESDDEAEPEPEPVPEPKKDKKDKKKKVESDDEAEPEPEPTPKKDKKDKKKKVESDDEAESEPEPAPKKDKKKHK
jgi:hypothetical protein